MQLSMDIEMIEEYLNHLEDKYTAEELVELLGLSTRDILERFRDECVDLKWR